MPRIVYIAGPMRNRPNFNVAAFDDAKALVLWRSRIGPHIQFGPNVRIISPADLDRKSGVAINDTGTISDADYRTAIGRSTAALISDATDIAFLPGWKESRGCQAELALSCALGLRQWVFRVNRFGHISDVAEMLDDHPDGDILEEALRITTHDRNSSYGDPEADFRKIASFWTTAFGGLLKPGASFNSLHVAQAMILLKMSRLSHRFKVDSVRDIAGYARCMMECVLHNRELVNDEANSVHGE